VKQIVKKILACAFVVKAHVVDAILLARAHEIFVAKQRASMTGSARNPYFIAVLACRVQCMRSCAALSSRTKEYRARAMSAT